MATKKPQSEPAVNLDEVGVQEALARETHDGKGEEEVPPSDFESYATEGVERENH